MWSKTWKMHSAWFRDTGKQLINHDNRIMKAYQTQSQLQMDCSCIFSTKRENKFQLMKSSYFTNLSQRFATRELCVGNGKEKIVNYALLNILRDLFFYQNTQIIHDQIYFWKIFDSNFWCSSLHSLQMDKYFLFTWFSLSSSYCSFSSCFRMQL